jgi:hypothetical protein
VDKRDGAGRAREPVIEDDSVSGVRQSPWAARQRAVEGAVTAIGERVLRRFELLSRVDRKSVLTMATRHVALMRPVAAVAMGPQAGPNPAPPVAMGPQAAPNPEAAHVITEDGAGAPVIVPAGLTEAKIAQAVYSAAIQAELKRFAEEIGVPHDEVAREIERAQRRAAALAGRERSVFYSVCALDAVATLEETGKVVLRAAVAHQMRWNTAHQNISRAWRKIGEGGKLGRWCGEWRAAHRFVWGPPSVTLWTAARAYMDACAGAGAVDSREAFDAWVKAHEAHNAWFNDWKKQSGRATRAWRDFLAALDARGVRPAACQPAISTRSAALGIERWVIPGRLAQQSWRDLLDAAHRPNAQAWDAWRTLLQDLGVFAEAEAKGEPSVEDAFREAEREAALADEACAELERAYRELLAVAERQPEESIRARERFRELILAADAGGSR